MGLSSQARPILACRECSPRPEMARAAPALIRTWWVSVRSPPPSSNVALPSRYIFSDKSKIPVMTYSQLQFIKAEAALRSGDQATARAAYINGISSHFDFVNARNLDDNQTPPQLTAADKATFLANASIVPAVVTLSHIMSQKFIAQWAWGHNEA